MESWTSRLSGPFNNLLTITIKCLPRSLFQIVNFPNSECVSEDGDAGVCMTSGECLSRSGLVSGSCAQGFGACCLVYHDQCGGTLEHNNTYIRCDNSKHIPNNNKWWYVCRNPKFPETYTEQSSCQWKITKISTEICFIRFSKKNFSFHF